MLVDLRYYCTMNKDLFGNDLPVEEKKNAKQVYQDYIASSRWKRLRDYKIDEVGGICERCGISKFSVKLDVHHKTYENFGKEKLSDLMVLCRDCHQIADKERKIVVHDQIFYKRFYAWAEKVYGVYWYADPGFFEAITSFGYWLQRKRERK